MSVTVDPAYRHYPKHAVFRGVAEMGGAALKLYHLTAVDAPVPDDVAKYCADWFDRHASTTLAAGDCGFVILHRCGADFYFLLLSVWRGSNELWEAVWYRQGDMQAFAPFDPACPPAAGVVRPTFCVWELGIVAHESGAWGRYLASPRDDAARVRWLEDIFEGAI
ncbi:hypothetical protein SAMN05428974_4030 [Sphingopyxis sp. YR583]|uniref:hypothetical protein n=1 Tax=Sphingopyxis sp. YR583 TaxID=1881047 RepID=UPI0008A7DAF4|nr:hypothetical protein [Sphingopyxis sp. YR583]SEH20360.1 hypothetical protein SAMN05428974_4030 [Sphingopyxis sp. YR583]